MSDRDEGIVELVTGRRRQSYRVEQAAHVLIVDDDPQVRALEATILQTHGFTSTQCASGLEALQAADREHFDAVLLDIRMPGLDGWEVLRLLRGMGFEMPVLIVSGDATPREAAEHGAESVVLKPFTVTELVDALNAALHGRRSCQATQPRTRRGPESSAHDREYLLARAS